jgi:hypothetical protein
MHTRIHNVTPSNLLQNDSFNPYSITYEEHADISNLCNFGWYKLVYYCGHNIFPINEKQLCHILGPLKNVGNEMAQAILTVTGK